MNRQKKRARIVRRVPLRKRIFLGCEGADEHNYAVWLQEKSQEFGHPCHIVKESLDGGGIRAVTEEGIRAWTRIHRRDPVDAAFLLLDTDREFFERGELEHSRRLALDNGIVLIEQHPCHEAHLLRHLPGFERRQFNTARDAKNELERVSGHRKLDRYQLARFLPNEFNALNRAAISTQNFILLVECIFGREFDPT